MSTETVTTARFKIRNVTTSSAWSDFEDAGFDFTPGDVLAFQLSEAPALDITTTLFRNDDPAGRISGGTALSFPAGGVATTPTSEVQVTTSGEVGTWAVECLVNGGTEAHQRRTRYIAARTANLDLRFMLQGERNEYNPIGGYVVSLQELIVAVDAGAAGAVPPTRNLIAGAGLTGGGTLAADRTFNVGANGDGSITVNANDIQVGILASDAQHGNRGGGGIHALVIAAGAAGFMSGSDKTKLDSMSSGAAVASVAVTGPIGNSGTSTAPNITWSPAADVAWNAHKITGLANGAASDDAAAFGQIAAALTSYVPTSRTLTAGAGLTGGGDLSSDRTFNVATADGTIQINTDSIEATGTFGAKNISQTGATSITAGSLGFIGAKLTNPSSTLDLGTGSETQINMGHGTITTSFNGLFDHVLAGIGNVSTLGRTLRNSTAATALATIQLFPDERYEGHAYISGADKTMYFRERRVPRTSTNLDWIVEYSTDGGSTWNEAFRYTTSTVGQFVGALQSYALACGGGGVFHDSSGSGMFFGGSGAIQLKSYDSGNPATWQLDGGLEHSFASGKTFLKQWGTAGTRVTYEAEARIATSDATPVNVISYTLPSSIACIASIFVTAADVSNGDTATYIKHYKVKRRAGGSVTLGTAAVVLEDEDDATWNARLVVSGAVISVEWTGDSADQVEGRARLVLDFNTYSPV